MKKLRDMVEAKISVNKKQYDWGKMITVHHGSDTSYPLHPEHQEAIKKLRPGMKTTFKDETGSSVHAHREGDTVHLHRPKTSHTLTSVPYHHFDESISMDLPVNAEGENAQSNDAKRKKQDATQKMAGLMQRKQKDVVEQTNPYLILENLIIEGYSEEDIAKGGTVIYKHEGKHYMSKVSHKTGGGAATKIHTISKLGHVVPLNHVVSTDASDWNKFKNSNVNEGATSTDNLKKQWDSHKDEERPSPMFAAHLKRVAKEIAKRNRQKKALKEGSMYTDPSVDKEMKATKKEYEHKAKHYEAKKVGDITTAEKEQRRMKKFQSIRNAINQSRPKTSYGPTKNSDIKPGNRRMD